MEKITDGAEFEIPLFVEVKEEPNSESDEDAEESNFQSNVKTEVKSGNLRISLQQREFMLQYMKSHPLLATGKLQGPGAASAKTKLLEELATELNACFSGATKSGDKWLKSWQDWKCDVKNKASKIRRHQSGTGGGPLCKKTLTDLEEKLLEFVGEVVVSGNADVPDPLETETDETRTMESQCTVQSPPVETVEEGPLNNKESETSVPQLKRRRCDPSVEDDRLCSAAENQNKNLQLNARKRQAAAEETKAAALKELAAAVRQQSAAIDQLTAAAERQAAAAEHLSAAAESQASAIREMKDIFATAVQCFQLQLEKNVGK